MRGVNWLGDAVPSVPALQRLREGKPGARITLLAPKKLAGLWEGQPFLDDLLLFSSGAGLWQTARRLRAENFAAAIAFPNSLRSALELWLAGIPRRHRLRAPGHEHYSLTHPVPPRAGAVPMRKRSDGEIRRLIARAASPAPAVDIASAQKPDAASILSHSLDATHHIHDYLGLVGALGVSSEPMPPRITISQEETQRTAAVLNLPPPADERPLLGMNPGAEDGPAKRWPAESYIAAAAAIEKAAHCRWVIFGGPSDMELSGLISRALRRSAAAPVINLAGQTTLRQLAGALKSCRLLLTNDTGPMHLAAAVGTPVVVPFGSTAPEMTGPVWSLASELLRAPGIPCAPCSRRECPIDFRCMTRIAPDAVVAAALRALAFSPS